MLYLLILFISIYFFLYLCIQIYRFTYSSYFATIAMCSIFYKKLVWCLVNFTDEIECKCRCTKDRYLYIEIKFVNLYIGGCFERSKRSQKGL